MDSRGVFGFLIVVKEAFELVSKNRKPMAVVALFSVLLAIATFVAFGFSVIALEQDLASIIKSLVRPRSYNPSDPRSFKPSLTPSQLQDQLDHIRQILLILYLVEIAFMFIFLIISFITTFATIIISAVSYAGNRLSMKDLFLNMRKTWTKPFLTSVYVTIHALGFSFILGLFAAPVFIYPNVVTVSIAVLLAIVVFLVYLYLVVIWVLALVVSVVEEGRYGMMAMGKASELIKGQRLKGYMLSLFMSLLNLILSVIYYVIFRSKGLLNAIYFGIFMIGFLSLLKILLVVAYTVLYFHCKKQHGEETEIHVGVVKYASLPTTDPVN